MAVPHPFVSIILTARHDNYGGHWNDRILRPLQFNCTRLSEAGIRFEVILVEWDPIRGRPLLSELLVERLPAPTVEVLTRIVVAPEYQLALTQNPRAGYLEYVAKNVGIRRARGEFVLVSNVDVLLGREVVQALAKGDLQQRTIYRAPRYDIKLGVDFAGLSPDALERPENHERRPVLRPPLFSGGAGDFLLADRASFHHLRGFNEVYRAARVGIDLNFLVKAHGAGYAIVELPGPVYHLNHVGSFRISKSMYRDASDTPWGDIRWHSRNVAYDNSDAWGLRDAPGRQRADGTITLDFSWRAVPPLIELKRIVLPARQVAADSV